MCLQIHVAAGALRMTRLPMQPTANSFEPHQLASDYLQDCVVFGDTCV